MTLRRLNSREMMLARLPSCPICQAPARASRRRKSDA